MMKKITLIAALFAVFSMNAQIWEDGFESYFDFDVDIAGDWTFIDLDADATYGSNAIDFTNEGYVGSAIVFNPSMATPDSSGDAWATRTGDKGLYAFASTGNNSGTPLNNDYIITPAIDLSGVSDGTLTFWAKSITEDFGAERLEVLLSTTGTEVADFTEDLSGGEITVPEGDYTELSYDLSAYAGETVHIAIHYVAQDSFVLQMDDFAVTGTLGIDDQNANGFVHFIDSNNSLNLRANVALENVQLFNIIGQEVVNRNLNTSDASVNLSDLTDGVYIARVSIAGTVETFKIIKK